MAEPGDLSRPEMRPGARLHSHYTRCQVGEERQHRVPAQPLRHNHLALAINAVNLKHRLRQIETDECCGHRTISVMKGTYPSRGTDVPDAGGRPSHHAGAERIRRTHCPANDAGGAVTTGAFGSFPAGRVAAGTGALSRSQHPGRRLLCLNGSAPYPLPSWRRRLADPRTSSDTQT